MEIEIRSYFVPSSDGVHQLVGKVYLPGSSPVGILHILHGMTEHIERYHAFMLEMAEAGYIVCGYDHLGHGHTARNASELGFIAATGGHDLLLRDVRTFSEQVRAEFGEGLPYVLMGHSMGSFIARMATEKYVTPHRLILMGTGGPNPVAGAGLALAGLIKACKGPRYISPFLDKMAFGSYNKRFPKEDALAWLTTDVEVRQRYAWDPFCSFSFTVSAMGDLIRLTKEANRFAWFTSLPEGLPVLLVSGGEDPVGGYGQGVKAVCTRLQKAGHPVICHIYDGYRHEILNDACHGQVLKDILDFLN